MLTSHACVQVYSFIAVMLTDWECLRTQSEYDSSLTFKLYVLQFVNYYSSLFYIAFFKGRFTGRPGDYNLVFGARQEEVRSLPGSLHVHVHSTVYYMYIFFVTFCCSVRAAAA